MVNIHQSKTDLSPPVDEAANGEPFVIATSGNPMAKVTAPDAHAGEQVRRLGFMWGQISVPEDFDRLGKDEILLLFGTGA